MTRREKTSRSLGLALSAALAAGCALGSPPLRLGLARLPAPAAPAGAPAPPRALETAPNRGLLTAVVYADAASPCRSPAPDGIPRRAPGATLTLRDTDGRELGRAVTNLAGRATFAPLPATGAVLFVSAEGAGCGLLEGFVSAPRLPGGTLAELSPGSTLMLKAMRAIAGERGLAMASLPVSPLSAAIHRLDALLPPEAQQEAIAASEGEALKLLQRTLAELPGLDAPVRRLFAEASEKGAAWLPDPLPGPSPGGSGGHRPPTPTPSPTPTPGTLLSTFVTESGPWFLTADAAGNVWAASAAGVVKHDPAGGVLFAQPTGSGAPGTARPHGVRLHPSTGEVWVFNTSDGSISVLNPADGTTALPGAAAYLFDGATYGGPVDGDFDALGNVWVTMSTADRVVQLDPAGATLGAYPVGDMPHGIGVAADGKVWVANYLGHSLSVLEADGSLNATIALPGSSPTYVAMDPARARAWVACEGTNEVRVYDTATQALLRSHPTPGGPYQVAVRASGEAWTTCVSGDAYRLNADGTTLGPFVLGAGAGVVPLGVAFDAEGDPWFAGRDSGRLYELAR